MYLYLWSLGQVASIVGALSVRQLGAKAGPGELRWTLMATLPGLALLVEYLARRRPGWGDAIESPEHYVTLWPGTLGLMLALVPILASYLDFPLLRWRSPFELVRTVHVATWLLAVIAVGVGLLDYGVNSL